MLEVVIAVVGAVVGVSSLALSVAVHRHNVRQAERLAERERRVERREQEADERETLVQPSMLQMTLTSSPSPLVDGYVQWWLEAANTSNQPLQGVTLCYDGVPLGRQSVLLPAGGTVRTQLPPVAATEAPPSPLLCSAEFTDAGGKRWRRLANGRLQSWAVGADGAGRWRTPVAPVVDPHPVQLGAPRDVMGPPPAGGVFRPPPARRSPVAAVALVLMLVLVAVTVWLLVR
ncbi:hypothetical protein [Streptomyces poonensis]|uniref:Uncharacterized protein n=1 Tax=Streptomyces poonensis TaxID=68255 RepID=A0A918UH54_9ACTN|nr:hypothetical protein [Streptomyces poonensis]GGZ11102.1 hypothetical protein GCM10010365_33210 [Streptomyces poonensis]GLJ91621.1 hypothetical protein GCM10017589_42280 [Streptomyces poonensis]